uniref:Uncharacterized protein n=1 Tax=Oryza nivara TaxID=4536 RepID=A0A0E0IJD0_ORYNI
MAAATPNGIPASRPLASSVPIEAVLFDIDGTLCDSDPLHHIGYNNGVPIDEEFFINNIAGRSDVEAAQNLFPDWPLEKGLKFLEDKEAKYRSLAKERLEPVKGLAKVVQWVKDHGYKRAADSASGTRAGVAAGIPVVAVATRNPEKSLLDAGATLIIKDYEDPKLWSALEEIDREEAKLKKADA